MGSDADTPSHAIDGVPSTGDILAGKYRVEKVLGVGGMGVVLSATHIQLEERVAIKFLLPEGVKNAEVVARFSREARAAVKIKSEHVARVIDVGSLESGAPFMVMEFLEGGDLDALIAREGMLAVEEVVDYILQACEAIAEAHALGIVHRDLKPANLYLASRPGGGQTIKVLDFGISKVTSKLGGSGAEASMTRTTAIIGSPLYMSPEQLASSRDVDARTDIWALGVILYELLAKQLPFLGESMPQLITAILSCNPTPLHAIRQDVPAELEAVIGRCLQRDVANRFADVAELAESLAPFSPRRGDALAERVTAVIRANGSRTTGTGGAATRSIRDHATMRDSSTTARAKTAGPSQKDAHGATLATFGKTDSGKTGAKTGTMVAIGVAALLVLGGGGMALRVATSGHEAAPATADPGSVGAAGTPQNAGANGANAAAKASATPAVPVVVAASQVPAAPVVSAAVVPAAAADAGAPVAAKVTGVGAAPQRAVVGAPTKAPVTAPPAGATAPSKPPAQSGSLFDDRK